MPYPSYIGSNINCVGYMGPSITVHDDVIKWKHSALLALFDGKPPGTKASYAELRRFLAPEQTIEQTIETPVIWDFIALIMTYFQCEIISTSLPVSVLQMIK